MPAKIEIFAPFGAAIELMQKILFRPFDLTKWFVIGFAAFLSHLAGGGSTFNWNNKFGDWKSRMHSATWNTNDTVNNVPGWVIPIIIIGVLAVLCLGAVFLWLGSRGKFIFADCIVRDRGAIAEPWHEFRREGNSLFIFSLLIALIFIAIVAIAASVLFLPAILHGHNVTFGFSMIFGGVIFLLVFVLLAIAWGLISQFMVPIMYRRRCTASEAFRVATALIGENLGTFILYLLFVIVLAIAAAMIGCIATCVTCCVAAIPYVGTVLLLPVYVTLAAYPLLFLRQFGSGYDVWAGVAPAMAETPPVQPTSSIEPLPPPAPATPPTEPPSPPTV